MSAERFTQLPRPPKRARLLCVRPRIRNPSLWPRVGVSFQVAKYVVTTKRDLVMSVKAQAAVSPAGQGPDVMGA